jgi:hypothetical protein
VVGESKLYEAVVDINPFIDGDVKLKNTDLSKLKYSWLVDTIVYADGTTESN